MENFRDTDLLTQLKPRGGLVRAWTVRSTMHTFPSKDYYIHVFGSGRNKILSGYDRWAKQLGMPPRDVRMEAFYQPLMDQIKGESVTSDYIKRFMTDRLTQLGLKSRMTLRRGWSSQPTEGPSWVGITEMSYLGMLVSAGRKGSQGLWMRTSDWLNSKINEPNPEDCIIELMRRYIQQYGPVTKSDIAYWCNRLLTDEIKRSIEALKKDLIQEHFEDSKEVYYSLSGISDEYVEPPKVIILPEFDSLMMGYKDRSRFLSLENLKNVSRPQGLISRTILIDGFVEATWKKKKQREGMTVNISPFRELNALERRSIEERFADYSEYLDTTIQIKFQ
jgi:hypothetical protein